MLDLKIFSVTAFQTNAVIISCRDKKEAVIVDPGGSVDTLLSYLRDNDFSAKAIWLTHSHLDHCGGVCHVKEAMPDVVLYGHEGEADFRKSVVSTAKMYGLGHSGDMLDSPEPDVFVEDGMELVVGVNKFVALHVPGHSPGHICYYCQDAKLLLSGDALFSGSIGRTDLPGGNYDQLMESIKTKLMALPDNTRVIAGHGPETTIGAEKQSNPFLLGVLDG